MRRRIFRSMAVLSLAVLSACSTTYVPDKFAVTDLASGQRFETWGTMGHKTNAGVWTFWDVGTRTEQKLSAYDTDTLIDGGWYDPNSREAQMYADDKYFYSRYSLGHNPADP